MLQLLIDILVFSDFVLWKYLNKGVKEQKVELSIFVPFFIVSLYQIINTYLSKNYNKL